MPNLTITVERRVLVSSRKFEDVIASIHAAVGHPDLPAFWKAVADASTYAELHGIMHGAVGHSGLMEFVRFNHGQFLQKTNNEVPGATPRIVRFVIGNPLIMVAMAAHVHDAGSYAPVTLLVDERDGAVHLSYDTMSSYLGGYGSQAAMRVAAELDARVEALIAAAAG